jgi:hypothetical protein
MNQRNLQAVCQIGGSDSLITLNILVKHACLYLARNKAIMPRSVVNNMRDT